MDVRNSLGGISNGVKGYTTIFHYPFPLTLTLSLKGRGNYY